MKSAPAATLKNDFKSSRRTPSRKSPFWTLFDAKDEFNGSSLPVLSKNRVPFFVTFIFWVIASTLSDVSTVTVLVFFGALYPGRGRMVNVI